MSEQRIEIVFFRMVGIDGSQYVEAEVMVNGSIEFIVKDDHTLTNTARNIIKKFGERTLVWTRWEKTREWFKQVARFWDSGNGAGREPVLMTPTSRLC